MKYIVCLFAFVGSIGAVHDASAADLVTSPALEIKTRTNSNTNIIIPISGPFRTQRLSKSITYREACPAEEPVVSNKDNSTGQKLESSGVELNERVPGDGVRQ